MQGKFNLGYFFKGTGITDWYKAWGMGWRLFATFIPIMIIGLILWKAFFVKNTVVNVGKGGTAIINQSRKRFFIPFAEGGVEQNRNSNMSTYIRAGLRFEF